MKCVTDSAAIRKRAKGQCLVYGCTKLGERKRGAYWYAVLRRNAKRRRKVFTITIEDFRQFCNEHEYLTKKGRAGASMTVDRIIDELGYVPGNIQPMSNSGNVRKRYTDYYKHQPDCSWSEPPLPQEDWERRPEPTDEDCPF